MLERDTGSVHIRLKTGRRDCVACVRLDAFEIVWAMAQEEAFSQVREMLAGRWVNNPEPTGGSG